MSSQDFGAIQRELTALRRATEDIAKSLKPKTFRSASHIPGVEVTSATAESNWRRKQNEDQRNHFSKNEVGDEVLGEIPVKLTWDNPEIPGSALLIRQTNGSIMIKILIEGEAAAIAADLIKSQPVEALSVDSVVQ